MINVARLRSDLSRLRRETDTLEATVASLDAAELTAASGCEGWTRAHVVAHLTVQAEALTAMIESLVSSGQAPALDGAAGQAEVEALAGADREQLLQRFRASTEAFAEAAARLPEVTGVESVTVDGREVPFTSLVALRIAEVVVHHQDLDTAWTLEEADPDSLLNAVEAAVRAVRAQDGAPGLTLRTEERDEWVIGDGALTVESDREGMLAWLSRGEEHDVEADGPLPALPAW